MLLSSLVPSIPHAFAADAPASAPWAEICTAHGLTVIAANGGLPAPEQEKRHQHSDCPWCRVHADLPALPPADPMQPLVLDGRPSHPVLFFQVSRPLFAWTTAQPRAPPILL